MIKNLLRIAYPTFIVPHDNITYKYHILSAIVNYQLDWSWSISCRCSCTLKLVISCKMLMTCSAYWVINLFESNNNAGVEWFHASFWFQVKVKSMEKFKVIASEPKDKNVFKIEQYNGLQGILENFQNRIFTVEGDVILLFCFYHFWSLILHQYILCGVPLQ